MRSENRMWSASSVKDRGNWLWMTSLWFSAIGACSSVACPEGFTKVLDQCVDSAPSCDAGGGQCKPPAPDAQDPCEVDTTRADCLDSHLLAVRSFGGEDPADYMHEAQNRGVDLASDDEGNVYVAGQFSGRARFGGTELISKGLTDGFVAKFDADLEPIWATATLGSKGLDGARHVAVDSRHEAWVLSCTALEDYNYSALVAHYEVALSKYAADGTLKTTIPFVVFGTVWTEERQLVAVDGHDNVYLALAFMGDTRLAGQSVSSLAPTLMDTVLAKFGPDGTLLWTQTYGGTLHTLAHSLTLVRRGGEERLLLGGSYTGSLQRNVPAPSADAMTASDAFVLELDLDGHSLQLTTDGSDATEERWDSVAGTVLTKDGRLVVGSIALELPKRETLDGWLGVYDASGHALGDKLMFGAGGQDGVLDLVVLADGRIAVAGTLSGLTGLTDDTYQPLGDPEQSDLLLAIFRDAGDHLEVDYSHTYGGLGLDRASGLEQTPSGHVYVTGMIEGMVEIGAFEVGLPNTRSMVLIKLSP
jgi:hypothetical protein